MERNYKVYKHTSPSNKVYIGITSQEVNRRWLNGKGYSHNLHFTNAINKYGWDNFKHEILFDNFTKEEAELMEQFQIALYDSTNRDKGYNISLGGNAVSVETREKLSKSSSGENNGMYGKKGELNPMYNRPWYDENTSEDKINKWKSNLSKAFSGENNPMYGVHLHRYGEDAPAYGMKHTDNWKREHSKRMSGKNNPVARRVKNIETGEIFDTIKNACERYNIKNNSSINQSIKKGCKAGGYHWEYVEENIKNNQEAS